MLFVFTCFSIMEITLYVSNVKRIIFFENILFFNKYSLSLRKETPQFAYYEILSKYHADILCIIRILKKIPLHNQCHLEMISSPTFK